MAKVTVLVKVAYPSIKWEMVGLYNKVRWGPNRIPKDMISPIESASAVIKSLVFQVFAVFTRVVPFNQVHLGMSKSIFILS